MQEDEMLSTRPFGHKLDWCGTGAWEGSCIGKFMVDVLFWIVGAKFGSIEVTYKSREMAANSFTWQLMTEGCCRKWWLSGWLQRRCVEQEVVRAAETWELRWREYGLELFLTFLEDDSKDLPERMGISDKKIFIWWWVVDVVFTLEGGCPFLYKMMI